MVLGLTIVAVVLAYAVLRRSGGKSGSVLPLR
jgi:hypothetical protein